jgi:hypothetical protein
MRSYKLKQYHLIFFSFYLTYNNNNNNPTIKPKFDFIYILKKNQIKYI